MFTNIYISLNNCFIKLFTQTRKADGIKSCRKRAICL